MKRGYSTANMRAPNDPGQRYLLGDIPSPLWRAFRRQCEREGVSVRAMLLDLVSAWTETETVTEDVASKLQQF